MKKIYSKVDGRLLHILTDAGDFDCTRNELVDADNFIQAALIRVNEGDAFRPHYHIDKDVTFTKFKAQEAWVVINGAIRIMLYDIDESVIYEVDMGERCCLITLHGGHAFKCIDDYTFVIEFKTGPYYGQEKDKRFIDAD